MRFVGLLLVLAAACGYPRPAPFGGPDDGSNGVPADGSAGDPPMFLSYAQNPAYFTKGDAGSDAPSVGGGPVMTWSVSPALPAGLTLDPTSGVIGGTPTAGVPTATYTVTAANANGMTTADVKLRVNDISQIATGTFHACAIDNGSILCWGQNQMGQVGNGAPGPDVLAPVDVAGTAGATSICAGDGHTCAVINGNVSCWGSNQFGQLGTTTPVGGSQSTPLQVTGLPGAASQVTCGEYHTCAIANGSAYCWGDNAQGQIGTGSVSSAPIPQPTPVQQLGNGVTVIGSESSGRTTCALVNNSMTLRCWGDGTGGQIMPNQGGAYPTPVTMSLPFNMPILSFATGVAHTCALIPPTTYCWGDNSHGQSGQPLSQPSVPNPAAVQGPAMRWLAAGHFHTCAALPPVPGGAVCWGDGSVGQLGDGVQGNTGTPTAVMNLTGNVMQIVAGANDSCALAGGHVFCWGDGMFHHLGNGMEADSDVPVPVTGL